MATIVEMINPLTGLPEQVDKLDHTAQEIDDAVDLAPQLSNPNLLDNWYFGNPVNQRNVSGTIDAVGYFLDRWKLVSGSVTIGSNGITLNGTIVQILETAVGTDVTASALTTEGVVVASYDNNSKTISLTGTGQTFVAAKLELGSQQTLAHQENGVWVLNEIPDYGEQLRRCQRYFFRLQLGYGYDSIGTGFANSTTGCRIPLPVPVPFRTVPSVTSTGSFALFKDGQSSISATISSVRGKSSLAMPVLEISASGLTQNGVYVLTSSSGDSSISLSADL